MIRDSGVDGVVGQLLKYESPSNIRAMHNTILAPSSSRTPLTCASVLALCTFIATMSCFSIFTCNKVIVK